MANTPRNALLIFEAEEQRQQADDSHLKGKICQEFQELLQ